MVDGENFNLPRGGYRVGISRGWRPSDIRMRYPPSGRLRFSHQPCVLAFMPQIQNKKTTFAMNFGAFQLSNFDEKYAHAVMSQTLDSVPLHCCYATTSMT